MKFAWVCAVPALLLAACGGGGGGSTGGVGTVPPVQLSAAIQQQSVQRAVASEALAVPSAANLAYTFTGVASAGMSRAVQSSARRVIAGWRAGAPIAQARSPLSGVTYSACSNGTESAAVVVSSTEEQLYVRAFYDSACTKLYEDVFLDVVAASSTTARASGTITTYATTGAVTDYETLTLTLVETSANSGTISVNLTDARSATSPLIAAVGISCSIGSSIACGFGGVEHQGASSGDIGETLAFAAGSSSTATSTAVSLNGNAAAYSGALNALTLTAGAFPAWTVSGGTTVDSATFGGTVTYAPSGAVIAVALTLSDAQSDATVTMTSSGTPPVVNGTIKQTDTGATVATFTVDAAGNGTITYSNGTTAQIVAWRVMA